MRSKSIQFMGNDTASHYDASRIVVLPLPYEGGTSYGKGTSSAPNAILKASAYLELYDEVLKNEPYKAGIFTAVAPGKPQTPEAMVAVLYKKLKQLVEDGKFVILLGGDHSISPTYAKVLHDKYGKLSVIQFDAHADLRDSYNGSRLSHACSMARIREITTNTLQIGIRSLSKAEADLIQKEDLSVCMMHEFRGNKFDIRTAIKRLSDPVFITFDVDVFDWSVVCSTGTPEPGGMTWDEVTNILKIISEHRQVVGFDIVELSGNQNDSNSAFAIAKLAYRMAGLFRSVE